MAVVLLDARDAHQQPLRGWGRYAFELTRHLHGDDLDVREVTRGGRGPEVLFEQIGLPRLARRAGADLVHAPNCFLPLRRPCPGVVTIHDLAFEVLRDDFAPKTGLKYRFFTPRAARSAQRVICVSRFTAEDVVARYGVDPERVRVVPNAPALAAGDAPVPEGSPYLLAVGDLRGKKNLERLVQAWRRASLDVRLVVAGHGDTAALPAGVEATGYVDDARLDALMRGAAALVHPSLYEGFGLVILEAMVRGTPVACSNTTALPETAGGAAVLFDPTSVDDIARALREVLDRGAWLAERGREHAAAFSWQRTAALTADVYREALAA